MNSEIPCTKKRKKGYIACMYYVIHNDQEYREVLHNSRCDNYHEKPLNNGKCN